MTVGFCDFLREEISVVRRETVCLLQITFNPNVQSNSIYKLNRQRHSLGRLEMICYMDCALYCAVLCCTVLCCALLYYAILYCAVPCCAVLYCAVLCCVVLCCRQTHHTEFSPRTDLQFDRRILMSEESQQNCAQATRS